MRRIVVDAERCTGCRLCELACSLHHEGRFSPELSKIRVLKIDRYGFDYPLLCHQCQRCSALLHCPRGALKRGPEGRLLLLEERCDGCGACAEACSLNALSLQGGRPKICDLCGGEPTCVDICPTSALSIRETEEVGETPEDALKRLQERWGIDA